MPTKINTLEPWSETRAALVLNLSSTLELLETEPFSDDPSSPYQQAEGEVQRITRAMRRLSVAGLSQIDDTLAGGSLVAELGRLSKTAKDEADRLKQATKTIEKIAKAVNSATQVVTAIGSLAVL